MSSSGEQQETRSGETALSTKISAAARRAALLSPVLPANLANHIVRRVCREIKLVNQGCTLEDLEAARARRKNGGGDDDDDEGAAIPRDRNPLNVITGELSLDIPNLNGSRVAQAQRAASNNNNNNGKKQKRTGSSKNNNRSSSAAAAAGRSGGTRSPSAFVSSDPRNVSGCTATGAATSSTQSKYQQQSNNNKQNSSSEGGKNSGNSNNNGKQHRIAKSVFDSIPRFGGPKGRYEKHQMLGQGSFGSTWLVEWIPDDTPVGNQQHLTGVRDNSKDLDAQSASGVHTGNEGALRPRSGHRSADSSGGLDGAGTGGAGAIVRPTGRNDQTQSTTRAGSVGRSGGSRRDGSPMHGGRSGGTQAQQMGNSSYSYNNNENAPHTRGQPLHPPRDERYAYTVSSPGAYSSLACTKAFVRLPSGREVPSEKVFVCKVESISAAKRKSQINSGAADFSEEKILSNCAHPCVVAFVDEFNDSLNHFLVMEYVDGGDLRGEIQRRLDADTLKYFSEASLLFLFSQICMGIEYLHRHNILHRDLKTSNILLSKKWLVKLADFGFAKQFDFDVDHNISTTTLGTPYYMAPEVLLKAPYGEKADMWSLGVILYELITLRRPFDGESVQELARKVIAEDYAPIYRDNISDELAGLVDALLNKNPALRPSAKEVLQSELMRSSVEEFIGKFTRAANASQSPLDRAWARVLAEHQTVLLGDVLSSSKSRTLLNRERSLLMHSRNMSRSMSQHGGAAAYGMGRQSSSSDASAPRGQLHENAGEEGEGGIVFVQTSSFGSGNILQQQTPPNSRLGVAGLFRPQQQPINIE